MEPTWIRANNRYFFCHGIDDDDDMFLVFAEFRIFDQDWKIAGEWRFYKYCQKGKYQHCKRKNIMFMSEDSMKSIVGEEAWTNFENWNNERVVERIL